MFDLIVTGGTAVLPYGTNVIDIGISGGKIAAIGSLQGETGARVLDATGRYVLPGLIDPHVHVADVSFNPPADAVDDFFTATVAAVFGGVTTVLDFVEPKPGVGLMDATRSRLQQAKGQAVIDYGLHVIVPELSPETWDTIELLPEMGINSIKLFTTFGDMANDDLLLQILSRAKELNLLAMVHAENKALTEAATKRLVDAGKVGFEYYPESRPPISESEAVARVIHLSQAAGNALYLVHISARESLEMIRLALGRGQPVWGETTSAYLTLTDEVYQTANAVRYRVLPPIRGQIHQDALWEGIRNGVINTIGSDHCGFHVSQKNAGRNDFRLVPPGLVGIETNPITVFSEGVSKGRISLMKFVEIASTNPARIFGLYPKKGVILPGSDADLCIIDPDITWRLTPDKLHFDWGWSPHEGMKIIGRTTSVIAGGEVILENGKFFGKRGHGRFLPRASGPAPEA